MKHEKVHHRCFRYHFPIFKSWIRVDWLHRSFVVIILCLTRVTNRLSMVVTTRVCRGSPHEVIPNFEFNPCSPGKLPYFTSVKKKNKKRCIPPHYHWPFQVPIYWRYLPYSEVYVYYIGLNEKGDIPRIHMAKDIWY